MEFDTYNIFVNTNALERKDQFLKQIILKIVL